ncbi:hypothetical protein [Mycolicibacterium arenosum]|uniref:Uncharacterized protein n=1 Tax=Mycolicibacterium arenosum TaxID=2952157 RepID=A0ABT1MC56_9MYCO|nr:hypothetical protein [Mycolicibacterium sp. CAU 1645]MCP9276743.1 hypothetical protein [Mycolicibacterium sp. CAU 1645]
MSIDDARADWLRTLLRTLLAAAAVGAALCTLMATNGYLPLAAAKPAFVVDGRGYVNTPARCDAAQTPVFAGRTPLSLIAICQDKRGGYEYRGMRLRDRALLKLPAEQLGNGCFGASTKDITYTVSERKLLLTAKLRVVRDEAMLEFTDFTAEAPAAAPVDKASGTVG